MAKLGADFNASSPTEADFVRHPSKPNLTTEIRFIRSRLKAFFDPLFQLENGDFKDNVIPQAAIVDHPDKPSSNGLQYTSVTVDKRGFVIDGSTDQLLTLPRHFRAFFSSQGAFIEAPDGVGTNPASTLTPWPDNRIPWETQYRSLPQVYPYKFIVPAGVRRLSVSLFGGGWKFGSAAIAPEQPKHLFVNAAVTPGNKFDVWVGGSDSPSVLARMEAESFCTTEGYIKNLSSPTAGYPDAGIARNPPAIYRPYGDNGASANQLGTPGCVIIEWYA